MKPKLLILMFGIIFLSLVCLSTVQALTIKNVNVFPAEIEPSETAIVTLDLKNNLNEDIEDVSISLVFKELVRDSFGNVVSINEVPFAPYDSSNEITIDELSENEEKSITFKVKVLNDAKSGVYKIPVRIVYFDGNRNEHTRDSLISITVGSEPVIGVSVEDDLLLKGEKNELSIKIVNKGLSDIKFLEIGIEKSKHYTILSPKSIYIGDIDSDDFDTAGFKLYFKKDVPSIVNLPVSLRYRDSLNREYEEDFNLQLRVYSKEKAVQLGLLKKSNTINYIIVIVVLIIAYIVYRKIKKRRKRKKASDGKEMNDEVY